MSLKTLDRDDVLFQPERLDRNQRSFEELAQLLAMADPSRVSGRGADLHQATAAAPAADRETHRRDLARALDLVGRASSLLERSDRRIRAIEEQAAAQLAVAQEQVLRAQADAQRFEQRAVEAEARARDAEARLQDANAWIGKLHDAITMAFSVYDRPAPARPEQGAASPY